MKPLSMAAASIALFLAAPVARAEAPPPHRLAQAGAAAAAVTTGEVRKVDKDAKKLTLRHGEIAHLGMPAMTMVFQVRDPALLDKVKAGDAVRFTAEKDGNTFIVTSIDVVP